MAHSFNKQEGGGCPKIILPLKSNDCFLGETHHGSGCWRAMWMLSNPSVAHSGYLLRTASTSCRGGAGCGGPACLGGPPVAYS
jgi:hypothetical protein